MLKYYFLIFLLLLIFDNYYYNLKYYLIFFFFYFGIFFLLVWLNINYKYIDILQNSNYKFFNILINYFTNFYFTNYIFILIFIFININANIFYKNFTYAAIYLVSYIFNNYSLTTLDQFLFEFSSPTNRNLLNYLVFWHPLILFYTVFKYIYFAHLLNSLVFFENNTLPIKVIYINFILQLLIWFTFFLGSWWASQELNWSLWWNWDIVECNLLYICVFISVFAHKIFTKNLTPYKSTNMRLYMYIFILNYFFLTKIDLFSSIHNFNNIVFLKKWFFFIYMVYSFLILKIFMLYKKFKINFYAYLILTLIYLYTYYYLILIFFFNFLFIEKLNFLFSIVFLLKLASILNTINFNFLISLPILLKNSFYLYSYTILIFFFNLYKVSKFFKNIHFYILLYIINLFWFSNSCCFINSKNISIKNILNNYNLILFSLELNYDFIFKKNQYILEYNIGIFEKNDIFYKNILMNFYDKLYYFVGNSIKNLNLFQIEFFTVLNLYYILIIFIFFIKCLLFLKKNLIILKSDII